MVQGLFHGIPNERTNWFIDREAVENYNDDDRHGGDPIQICRNAEMSMAMMRYMPLWELEQLLDQRNKE